MALTLVVGGIGAVLMGRCSFQAWRFKVRGISAAFALMSALCVFMAAASVAGMVSA